MTVTISRLYNNYPDAQAAIKRLEAAGVDHGEISVLASNADGWYKDSQPAKPDTFPDRDLDGKDDRAEAAGTGAGVGAALGGTAGVLTGLGLMAIPGVGPIVAGGWLVSALAGAAAGGATGGVLGALTQAGVGKDEADVYAESLRRGGAVVSSRVADADASRLQAVLNSSAVQVADRGASYRKSPTGGVRVNIGDAPVATSSSALLPFNWIQQYKVTPGQKVSALRNDGVAGTLVVVELTN